MQMNPYDIENYKFDLPEELIAQNPLPERDSSRLLVVQRDKGRFEHHYFYELEELLIPGDLIVLNNTKVIPARLYGRKDTGGKVEIIVLNTPEKELSSHTKWCLTRTSKGLKKGMKILLPGDFTGVVEEVGQKGMTKIRFMGNMPLHEYLGHKGIMPLPPYIKRSRDMKCHEVDRNRYQTVFSKVPGAIAAPTAGLHFSNELIKRLNEKGISTVEITLHVGYGTFKPVRSKDIREHKIDPELYEIDGNVAELINNAKQEKRRIIAVGTTVVRTLETAYSKDSGLRPGRGVTDLYIIPGYRFKIVDALITNFHLPGSSLIFLVCAFGGIRLIMDAYRLAVKERYRFYSYGDAMLII